MVFKALSFLLVLLLQQVTVPIQDGFDRLSSPSGLRHSYKPAVEVYTDHEGRRRIVWESIPIYLRFVLTRLDWLRWSHYQGRIFVTGGFVRDLLLGRQPRDLDLIGVEKGLIRPLLNSSLLTVTSFGFSQWNPSTQPHEDPSYGMGFHIAGMRIDILDDLLVDPLTGKPIPEKPDFSFNHFLLGFDEGEDPYLLDPYDAYEKDLFPLEGPRKGRLVGDMRYLTLGKSFVKPIMRFLRWAKDQKLALVMEPKSVHQIAELARDTRGLIKDPLGYPGVTKEIHRWSNGRGMVTLKELMVDFDEWQASWTLSQSL